MSNKNSDYVDICMQIAKGMGVNCLVLAEGAAGTSGDTLKNLDFKALSVLVPDIIDRINKK